MYTGFFLNVPPFAGIQLTISLVLALSLPAFSFPKIYSTLLSFDFFSPVSSVIVWLHFTEISGQKENKRSVCNI